jgi:hypothetical protein
MARPLVERPILIRRVAPESNEEKLPRRHRASLPTGGGPPGRQAGNALALPWCVVFGCWGSIAFVLYPL